MRHIYIVLVIHNAAAYAQSPIVERKRGSCSDSGFPYFVLLENCYPTFSGIYYCVIHFEKFNYV